MPGSLERVEDGVGDRDVGGLVPAAEPDPRPPEARAARRRCRRGPSRAAAPARRPSAARRAAAPVAGRPPAPSPVAPVTARSPRSMIAAFSRAIAATVGPSRSMWSRATLVIAATPPSQAWVASSRPPSPTSTSATSRSLLREPAEDDRGQQLELGRRRRGAARPGRRRRGPRRRGARTSPGSIGRPSICSRSR